MKNYILTILALLLLTGCSKTYQRVVKSADYGYKYEYAKELYARGKFTPACELLTDVVTIMKGTQSAEESLFLLALAQYHNKDYEVAAEYFRKYYKTYPKGVYGEKSCFYIGESLYQSTPEPRLDQTETINAIAAFQEFLDIYSESQAKEQAQQRIIELQNKLVRKEYLSAQLYYNLGSYFGNCLSGGSNYEACIITAENALKDYPYCTERESFALLIMKSKYYLAKMSVEAKQEERFRAAEDECYGFINEYPDSKSRPLAEKYIADCKKYLKNKG